MTVIGTNATAIIRDSLFNNNSADIGGALSSLLGANVQVATSNLKQNSASYGAAIYSATGSFVLLQEVSTAGTHQLLIYSVY